LLSTFFRLSFLLRELLREELVNVNDLRIHPNIFYLKNYNFFGIERIGGTFSYLKNKYNEIIKSKLGPPFDSRNDDDNNSNIFTSDVFNYSKVTIMTTITKCLVLIPCVPAYIFIGSDSIIFE